MTPYRGPTVPRSAITRTAGRTRVLLVYVALLAIAAVGFALAPSLGWIADTFVAGVGAAIAACAALGVLFGKVLGGSGSAPCPVCGARIDDLERRGAMKGILCGKCGAFVEGDGGTIRPVDPEAVDDDPIFGAVAPETFVWPPGCVVCGAEATRIFPIRVSNVDGERLAISAVGLAMAGAIGAGFILRAGKRIAINVPHCAAHDDGAVLTHGGPSGFLLLFRSRPYQRAFCDQNRTPPAESPETGRAALVSLRLASTDPSSKPAPSRRAARRPARDAEREP